MEININNEVLDEYSTLYDSEDFVLAKAFKDKGFDDKVLHQVKCIEVLVDSLICQKEIYNNTL